MKKTIAILLAAIMVFAMAACGSRTVSDPDADIYTPENDPPLDGPGTINYSQAPVSEPKEISLTFTEDEWPVVDGATAFLPFYQEMTARMLGVSNEEAGEYLLCSTTDYAYPYLWQGKVDLIFCLRPSEEQVAEARENNVVFEEVPFANEGFVFFVNKNNPVDDITAEQLHDIYSGKITNWKELGGNDEEIIAYQRTEGSGSQTGLYLHVISPDEVQEPPIEKRIGTMGGIIDAVAGYENAEGAIGYSYRYFVTNMHYDEQIKMLRVNGVYPEYSTIASGDYPLISDVCAVFREDEPADSAVRKIANWCCSSQGAWLAKELGYIPTAEATGTLYTAESNDPDTVTVDYAKGNPCPECSVMHTYYENNLEFQDINVEDGENYAAFVRISGLKDKAVERQINRLIEDRFYELYDADLPPYPGVKTRAAMFDSYGDCDSYQSCTSYVTGSFNNILSIQFSKYTSSYYYSEEESDSFNIEDCRTLNIDLNTGKEISIADLFADNIDGIAYINEKIAAESDKPEAFDEPDRLWSDSQSALIHFRRAFEGINTNQKYYINSCDGRLYIVLDYENPEIACLDTPTYYSVDMLGINAYEKRFMNSESIFSDETISPCLFQVSFEDISTDGKFEYIEDWIPEYHVSLSVDADVYDDMSEAVIAELAPDEEKLGWLEEYARNSCEYLTKAYGKAPYSASANFCSYGDRYGSYTNTFCFTSFYAADSNWNYIDDMNKAVRKCFTSDSPAPLGLNDIFAPDCDMYAVMENASLKRLYDQVGYWIDENSFVNMFHAVLTHLDGFSLNKDCLTLDCRSINDIIYTYLPWETDNWDLKTSLTELRYKDLGMENLTIFN